MPDNKITYMNTDVHPFARYLDAFTESLEAPEFVVDDVLAAGTVVVAGERGLGKTSALVPLVMACTGLLTGYPLKASIRRRVVYVAEDPTQVQRIISAMRSSGLLDVDRDEFNQWFRVVGATRLPATEIVKVVPFYDDLWTPNTKVDSTEYLAPPVVVLDTTNATIDLENISDNAAVSQAVSELRQKFGPICLVLVGHVSKASRSDARQLSFIGAGSWEGDTQQALYLVSEDDQRYLVLGKRRFESDVSEYRINSVVSAFDAVDKLGRTVEIKCFYGVPEATTDEKRAEDKAQRQAELKAAAWTAAQNRVIAYVRLYPGRSTRDISETVTGKDTTIRKALEELVELGGIRVEDGPRGAKYHYLEIGTRWDTVGKSQ